MVPVTFPQPFVLEELHGVLVHGIRHVEHLEAIALQPLRRYRNINRTIRVLLVRLRSENF